MKTKIIITVLLLVAFQNVLEAQELRPKLEKAIVGIGDTFSDIPLERRFKLDQLASMFFKDQKSGKYRPIVFVDSENGSTSQLSQIWLSTGLTYFGITDFNVFSAGNEVKPQNLPEVAALNQYGFKVKNTHKKKPFSYHLSYGDGAWDIYPKTINDLALESNALTVYVEEGVVKDTKAITISFVDSINISKEMLYLSSRINNIIQAKSSQ